jgi:peptidoglycan/LPS O-acetylase OafA/YrhL
LQAIHNLPMDLGQGVGSRWSAPVQSLVSTALVIPTIPVWYLRLVPFYRDWDSVLSGIWTLALTLVIDLYFVVVVTIFARNRRRRVFALVTAVMASVLDVGDSAIQTYTTPSDVLIWADRVLTVVIFVLLVSAWGISRRRRLLWVIGLVPALVIAILLAALYASDLLYDTFTDVWIVYWGFWVGAFLLCSVICWGFDALASATNAKPVAHPADGRMR